MLRFLIVSVCLLTSASALRSGRSELRPSLRAYIQELDMFSVLASGDVHDVRGAHGTEPERARYVFLLYGILVAGMVLVCTAMFCHMGAPVVIQVVVYICCLSLIKITLKVVYQYGFHYPKFITTLHMLTSSLAAFAVLLWRRQATGQSIAMPTRTELATGILPIALTFGLSIGLENSALVSVTAAFSEVVAASNPVMSAFLTWVFGMGFDVWLLAPIAVVITGCVVSIQGEINFSPFGLALLLMSVVLRCLKAVLQMKMMKGETEDKYDPTTLMAWTSLFGCILLCAFSCTTEGLAPLRALKNEADLLGLLMALLLSCMVACTLNIAALFVIKKLGAVGAQMVSQMKSLLVVIGGVALLSETFTAVQYVGFGAVLAGVYWFSHMKRQSSALDGKDGGGH